MYKGIKGAIFDVDGTLLESMGIWNDVGERYLRARGLTPEPGLGKILFPMSLEEGADYIIAHYDVTESREEIIAGVLQIVEYFYMHEVELKPGVREMLSDLKEKNIPMVVATTNVRSQIEEAFQRLGILDYFEKMFTCSEVGSGKSDARIYEEAAKCLQTKPNETLVFEDALHAAETAKRAGFLVVGLYDEASRANWEEIQKLTDISMKEMNAAKLWDTI